jgi:hypothetical protein
MFIKAMHALPQGCFEEVGMCRADPAELQLLYGFCPRQLPPIGASPDGLVRQRQPSTASAVRVACPPVYFLASLIRALNTEQRQFNRIASARDASHPLQA